MVEQRDIRMFFKDEEAAFFDFSQAPGLVRCPRMDALKTSIAKSRKENSVSRWTTAQRTFSIWARDTRVFTGKYVGKTKAAHDVFFDRRGFLRGDVLDIGGAWGLYRQWWEPGESDVFVVHDPDVETFLQGVNKVHARYYQRALTLPMSFVEGLGEILPYKEDIFDTAFLGSTLDHCIDPAKVLAGAYRCLKPGGTILIMHRCYSSGRHWLDDFRRTLECLDDPRYLFSRIYSRLFYRSAHLHCFAPGDIASLLREAGFSGITTGTLTPFESVHTFEATKESVITA